MQLARRFPRVTLLAAGGGALAAVGILDCTLQQKLGGDFDTMVTLRWSLATLVPLLAGAAWLAVQPLPNFVFPAALPKLAVATGVVLAASVAADAMAFPGGEAAEWLDKARSKLPGAVAFVALGMTARLWHGQAGDADPAPVAKADLTGADAAAIAQARLVRAAGSYVEVVDAAGRVRLIRAPIASVEGQPAAGGLVRLHRSLLVRSSAIAAWRNDRSGLVCAILDDGTPVRIGRKYRPAAYALRDTCRSSPAS